MLPSLFLVFSLLALGALSRRYRRFPDNGADVLNRFIIDVCLPATILRVVPTLTLHAGLLVLVVIPWAMAALSYAISLGIGRWLRLDTHVRTVLFLTTALGNTSFLGFPMCKALLGEESLPLAAVYDQLGSFLLLSVIAPIAIGNVSSGSRPTPKAIVEKVVTFPPFIALMVALLPLPRPAFVEPLLSAAAAPLVPLAMFSVGMKLPFARPRGARVLALGLALKLIVLPLCAWGILRVLHVPPLVLEVAVLESAMPTMITAGAVLMAAGLAVELVAALVGWGLVLSLATLPTWAWLLRLP